MNGESRINDSPEKPGLFLQKFDFLAQPLLCKSLTKLIENDYQYHRCRLFHLTISKTKIPFIKLFSAKVLQKFNEN